MRPARIGTVLALLGLALSAPVGAAAPAGAAFDHSIFDRILRENVHAGLVDYGRIRATRSDDLRRYLMRLAAADPTRLLREERLAFYINLYNAAMIRAVLDHPEPGWTPAANGFIVFEEPRVRLMARRISLNQLEKGIILHAFHEPRVHAALVCAARSCPPLIPRAYRGSDLDGVLEENMRRFLADTTRNQVDAASRTLRLSPIFKWYAGDFDPVGGVAAFVGRALGRDFTGWRITYLDYDWTLNAARGGGENR